MSMNRVNSIWQHQDYQRYIKKNESYETGRIYCTHGIQHFMDVARIAYILILEEQAPFSKEIVYATALLHDIGRFMQYEDGTPHEIASGKLCIDILKDCDFNPKEITEIKTAIENHRNNDIKDETNLSGYIYRGDKLSRLCVACSAKDTCNRPLDKKNMIMDY